MSATRLPATPASHSAPTLSPHDWQRLEVIRLLEQDGYPLSGDTRQATQLAAQGQADLATRLNRRASLLDNDHRIESTLQQLQRRVSLIWLGMTLLAALLGFAVVQVWLLGQYVNFFGLWIAVLTANAISLLLWAAFSLTDSKRLKASVLDLLPERLLNWWQLRDPVYRAALQAHGEMLSHGYLRADWSRRWHQVWLAGLLGMALGLLMALLTRQYIFIWESTLLDTAGLLKVTHLLAWLPQQLGFAVPSDQAIVAARQYIRPGGVVQDSRVWASLLLGSLLCYAVLPRLAGWLISLGQTGQARKRLQPDLSLPYYRQLAQRLAPPAPRIVDRDDLQPDHYRPVQTARKGPVVTMLLSVPELAGQSSWGELAGQPAQHDLGLIDSREQRDAAISQLKQWAPCQLRVGVRLTSVPDRGTLRQLDQLVQVAGGGASAVGLLLPDDPAERQLRIEQWTAALDGMGIELILIQ